MLRSHESTTDSILTLHSYRTNFIWKPKPVSVALFLYGFLWRCDYEFIAEHSFLFHPRLCFYYYFVVCFICVFQLRCCCCCWFCRIFFLSLIFLNLSFHLQFSNVLLPDQSRFSSVYSLAMGLPSKNWLCNHNFNF